MEHIVTQRGVPLSDRGKAILTRLMYEVYELLGIKMVNSTAYQLQADDLMERFIRTLTIVLTKTVCRNKDKFRMNNYLLFFMHAGLVSKNLQGNHLYLLCQRCQWMRLLMLQFSLKLLTRMTTEQN